MRGVLVGVALVAVGLYFVGLDHAPFLDPPEGFHASIARTMMQTGDWLTPRVDGVRYFDKPPVLYWLIALAFTIGGPTPEAARFWPAVCAVGVAVVTARIGTLLGGVRLGLLAGLLVAANLGVYVYGRIVKPDLPFMLCIMLAFAGLVLTYRGAGRWPLALFYASLGLATLTKDVLGAIGPLTVVGLFFWLTRERPIRPWIPWWGVLLLLTVAVPWYALVQARNAGYLWYTVVDNHVLNFTRQRVFPDEDVPLGPLVFLGVTIAAFLPWTLSVPWAVARILRRASDNGSTWKDATARLWLFFALWPLAVIGFFTISPFKLPHYGLPAFPALALLAARAWDECIEAVPGAPPPRALAAPVATLYAVVAAAFAAAALGVLHLPADALGNVDVATRNLVARGLTAPPLPAADYTPIVVAGAVIFAVAAAVLAVAAWQRRPGLALAVALAAMAAFLPLAGEGMAYYAKSRSARPIVQALALRLGPGDEVIHEGPLENSGSILLTVDRPVHIVNGMRSNLAYGATFPEARDIFWDADRFRTEWAQRGRRFLVSAVSPERSIVRTLPRGSARLVAEGDGRRLYTNLGD